MHVYIHGRAHFHEYIYGNILKVYFQVFCDVEEKKKRMKRKDLETRHEGPRGWKRRVDTAMRPRRRQPCMDDDDTQTDVCVIICACIIVSLCILV